MNLLKINQSYYGIDIGNQYIKTVQLKRTMKGLKLEHLTRTPVPVGAVRQGHIQDHHLAINLLHNIKEQIKLGRQGAYMAFTGQNAIVRELEMPLMTDKELAEAVYWEAAKVLPYPVEDAIIDWVVLETVKETGMMMRVLLIAARADYIRSYLKPIKAAGIRPMNLSILPFPLMYVLKYAPEFQELATGAVIDMGAQGTHVLITKDGMPKLSRTIPTGGNDFTEALSNAIGLTFEESEKVKLEYGTLQQSNVLFDETDLMNNPYLGIDGVLAAVAQDVLGEIKRSFVHFQLHNRGQLIQKVFVTGGASMIPGMKEEMEAFLNVPVQFFEFEKYFLIDPEIKEMVNREGAFFAEALGLALSEV